MTRRNLTTALMVMEAGLLLYGGVALARESQPLDDHRAPAAVTESPSPSVEALPGSASPSIEPGDDKGGNGADDAASPSASADDKGGKGADDAASPSASADDKGGKGADDAASPSASADDKGGNGADDAASPSASADDKGGKGGGDSN